MKMLNIFFDMLFVIAGCLLCVCASIGVILESDIISRLCICLAGIMMACLGYLCMKENAKIV